MIANGKFPHLDNADVQTISQEHLKRFSAERLASAIGQSPARGLLPNFLFVCLPVAYCLKIRRTIAARSGSGIKLSRIARGAFR